MCYSEKGVYQPPGQWWGPLWASSFQMALFPLHCLISLRTSPAHLARAGSRGDLRELPVLVMQSAARKAHNSMLAALHVCRDMRGRPDHRDRHISCRRSPHLPESVQEQEDAVVFLQDVTGDGVHGLARENACQHVHRVHTQRWPRHLPHTKAPSLASHMVRGSTRSHLHKGL